MRLAHFISLQQEIPDFDHFVNGKSMAHSSDELETIAKELNVTSIMDFYGRKWHEADKGIETVSALISYLIANPSALADSFDVIDDLKEWHEVLLRAKHETVKWKMKIDY